MDLTPHSSRGATNPKRGRQRLRGLLALPLAALVLSGCTLPNFYAKESVTTTGRSTFHLWQGFTVAALIIGGFVLLLILYAVLRYRRKGDTIPKQTQYHLPLEWLYTVVPIIIVIALFAATVVVENKVTAEPKTNYVIKVYAFQWGWKFQYPGSNALIVGQTTQSPMFEMPVNTDVRFELQSLDVVHGFYLRDFNFSRYAQPGINNTFTFHALETGTFFGQCTQLCGLYHSLMFFRVKVVTMDEYNKWLHEFDTKAGAAAAEAAAIASNQQTSPQVPAKPTSSSGAQ